jgi:hypothetical protein
VSEVQPGFYILPAEHVGEAAVVEGFVDVGGVKVPVWGGGVHVYVRRSSEDLSVMEICMARHDGLSQEELDEQNRMAEEYPLGAMEYWRSEMVGKYSNSDGSLMTESDFLEYWGEDGDLESD